jgi:APA family basic amino acid/polyamine antiporter
MTELRRALGTFDLTMIAVGSTIGSGIFLTPAIISRELPDPVWVLAAWLLGGIMALTGALTFAELGAMMPRAGGVYVYLAETYGRFAGFLYGWAYVLVVNTGGIAALSIACATYLGFFVPLGPGELTLVALGCIVAITLVNALGVRAGGIFSDLFAVIKLAAMLSLIVLGLSCGGRLLEQPSMSGAETDTLPSAMAAALVGVFWSYGGWQHATFVAGEARAAARSVPRALVSGAVIVTVVYLLTVTAYMALLSPAGVGASPRVAADAASAVLGGAGAGIVSAAIALSTFGTAGIYTLTAPRIYYAMAVDGVFFRSVARLNPRTGAPVTSILLQSSWAAVLVFFWGTFENLISYVVFTDWIFFGLAGAGVFILRRRNPRAERAVRIPLYPLPPLVFVGISALFVGVTLVGKPAQAAAGLGFLALGVLAYRAWARSKKLREE